MKKVILITSLLLGLITPVSAGLFDELVTMDQKMVKPTVYKLDTHGYNLRVYEWTPLANPNIRCVFVAGNKKGGTACYPVK